jgi:hypothetical protein
MERTLVILLGNARGGEKTWYTMFENLIQPYNADLALLFGETTSRDNSLFKAAKYVWEVPEYINWADFYINNCTGNWREFYDKNKDTGISGGIDGYIGSGSIIFAFRHHLKLNYSEILLQYDRIILTRSDHYYLFEHPVLPNDAFYIVEGEDYGGVCDRHHIFPSHMYEDVLGIVDYICSPDSLQLSNVNPERALLEYYKHNGLFSNIKRSMRVQFTVKLDDDQTRWQHGQQRMLDNNDLFLKYPNEYKIALSNKQQFCRNK